METLAIGLFVLLFGAVLTGHEIDVIHIVPGPTPRIQQVQPTPVTPFHPNPPTAYSYFTPERP